MKKILLAVAAVATFASCSQNEEFENVGQKAEINFVPVVKNTTRAAILDEVVLKTAGFQAYAYNVGTDGNGSLEKPIFGNGGVTVTYQTNAWKYTGTYYWPTDAKVKFFAYAPSASTAATYALATPASDTAPTISYTVPAVDKQEDLVIASTAALAYAENGVALTFNHALTQVNFSVKGEDALTYELTDVKITGVADKGTYNFTKWAAEGSAGEYVYPIGSSPVSVTNSATKDLMQTDGALMLLPQEFAAGSTAKIIVNYTVKDANGDPIYTATNKEVKLAGSTAWEMGKKIRYVLTLTNDAKSVSFGEPIVTPWSENDDTEVNK